MSKTHTVTLTGRIAISAISPLFLDRFGRSLQFYHLEFYKEAIFIYDGYIEEWKSWASVAQLTLFYKNCDGVGFIIHISLCQINTNAET